MVRSCPGCGSLVAPYAEVCEHCGRTLDGATLTDLLPVEPGPRKRPRWLVPTVALAVVASVVGVAVWLLGAKRTAPSAAEIVASSADQTRRARTLELGFTGEATSQGKHANLLDESATIDSHGRFGRGTLKIDGRSVSFLCASEAYYYAVPGLGPGKQWLKVTFDDIKQRTGVDVGAAVQTDQDPTQVLNSVRGVSGPITTVGRERLFGVDVTHYRTTIDFARGAQRSGALSGPALEAARKIGIAPVELWIDGDRRMRRFSYSMDAGTVLSDAPPGARITWTLSITGFDRPLDVVAPPPDTTVDLATYRARSHSA